MRESSAVFRPAAIGTRVSSPNAPVEWMLSRAGRADTDVLGCAVGHVGTLVEPCGISADLPRDHLPHRPVIASSAPFVVDRVRDLVPDDVLHDGPPPFLGIKPRQRDDTDAATAMLPLTDAQAAARSVESKGPPEREEIAVQRPIAQRRHETTCSSADLCNVVHAPGLSTKRESCTDLISQRRFGAAATARAANGSVVRSNLRRRTTRFTRENL